MNILKNINLRSKYFGYFEGIIYVILTILIIFTSIAGPIIIRLLPLIFVLGIVGRTIFNRPIITSIFGFLISICTIYMIGTYSLLHNLMYSLFCFISILIGEVCGMYLIRYINRKDKKITRKNIKNILSVILIVFAGIYLNNYVNGNIYSYFKCKQIVKDYISLNYPGSNNVKIFNGSYALNEYQYYSFNVNNIDINDNCIYKFGVYLDNKVIDGYMNSKISLKSQVLRVKFLESIELQSYKNFDIDIEYSDLHNNMTLYITKNVDEINLVQLNKFAEDVNNILDGTSLFKKFGNVSKMNICIKSKEDKLDAEIYSTDFYDKDYYVDSLETEYLDK